jgi:hypothetical protein
MSEKGTLMDHGKFAFDSTEEVPKTPIETRDYPGRLSLSGKKSLQNLVPLLRNFDDLKVALGPAKFYRCISHTWPPVR